MSNPRFNKQTAHSRGRDAAPAKRSAKGSSASVNEKAVAWPGLPGGTQPRDRSAGVPKRGFAARFAVGDKGL